MSRGRPGRVLVAALLVLGAARCGDCDCGLPSETPAFLLPAKRTADGGAGASASTPDAHGGMTNLVAPPLVRFVASTDEKGRPVVAGSDAKGGVWYETRDRVGWEGEPVTTGAVGGPISMSRAPGSDEAIVAVVVHPNPDLGNPPVGAHPGAPAAKVPGEGELVVARRRMASLFRLRPVASRALLPSVAVDSKGRIHLVFLQPGPGGYVVTYVRLDATSVVRAEVGRTSIARAPVIGLFSDRPEIAYVGDGPQIVLAHAGPGMVFSGRPVPAGVLGAPAVPPDALAMLVREGVPPVLAFVRPFAGGKLRMFGHPAPLPKAARGGADLLMVAVFDGTGKECEILAAMPHGKKPPQVAITASKAGLVVAASAGGVPVRAVRNPGGWETKVATTGVATGAGLAGERPVYAIDGLPTALPAPAVR